MGKYLDSDALTYLWAKIKSKFATIDHKHDDVYSKEEVDTLVASLLNRITALESGKQDKIESWNDLIE